MGHGWRKGMGRTRGQMPRKPCPPSSPSFPRGTFFSFSHTPVFPLPRTVYFPKDGSGGPREGFSRGGSSQKWGLSLGFGWDPCLPRQARRVHVAHPFWSAPSRGVCPSGVFDRLPPGVSAESLLVFVLVILFEKERNRGPFVLACQWTRRRLASVTVCFLSFEPARARACFF